MDQAGLWYWSAPGQDWWLVPSVPKVPMLVLEMSLNTSMDHFLSDMFFLSLEVYRLHGPEYREKAKHFLE